MRYLGVSRAELYSPGRVSGDAAIFRAVASELGRHGHEVSCMTEQELIEHGIPAGVDGIFQMCRSARALDVLRGASVPVINSADAVAGCRRANQVRILQGTGLLPDSMICSTHAVPEGWNTYPCWIKRADSHAVDKYDVTYASCEAECSAALRALAARGLGECVIQAHVKGWIVKFYGVRGTGLTDCYASSAADGKFGLERYNDSPEQAYVDVESLTAAAEMAAELLGVDVYGGDAIVGPDGSITIIDFNDWPSFRSCTVGAALKIAELIIAKTDDRKEK